MFERQSFVWGFLFCTLIGLPLLYLGSCADDLTGATGASGQDAAATPNVSIRGGGTITWSTENDQVSFTEDIVIRDHARGSVYTITPSASPITLANTGDISYVELIRESAAEETITDTTEVQSGSIELEGGNSVAVTLFERPETDVIYIPWVQKELVTGDEWRFGTALSWYEARTNQSKPAFGSASALSQTAAVFASEDRPAVVRIEGKIYVNAEDVTVDLSLEGRGGMDDLNDLAPLTPLYLFAIPADTGRTFDLVASAGGPASGPNGFAVWSYLGAFCTQRDSANTPSFHSVDGFFNSDIMLEEEIVDGTADGTGPVERTIDALPPHVKKGYFQMRIDGTDLTGNGRIASRNTTSRNLLQGLFVSNQSSYTQGWVPIYGTQRVYLVTNRADNEVRARLLGWQEDPMAYK